MVPTERRTPTVSIGGGTYGSGGCDDAPHDDGPGARARLVAKGAEAGWGHGRERRRPAVGHRGRSAEVDAEPYEIES